jgi:hypothetical protein
MHHIIVLSIHVNGGNFIFYYRRRRSRLLRLLGVALLRCDIVSLLIVLLGVLLLIAVLLGVASLLAVHGCDG